MRASPSPLNTHPNPPEGRENELANSTGFQRALFQSSRKREIIVETHPSPPEGREIIIGTHPSPPEKGKL